MPSVDSLLMSHSCCCLDTTVPILSQNHINMSKNGNPDRYTSTQSSWNNVCALNCNFVTYATIDIKLQLRNLCYYKHIAAAFEVFFDFSNLQMDCDYFAIPFLLCKFILIQFIVFCCNHHYCQQFCSSSNFVFRFTKSRLLFLYKKFSNAKNYMRCLY